MGHFLIWCTQEVTVHEGTRFNREQWATQLSPIVQLWQKVCLHLPYRHNLIIYSSQLEMTF